MACLWFDAISGWTVFPLDDPAYTITADPRRPLVPSSPRHPPSDLTVLRITQRGRPAHLLFSPRRREVLRVNGRSVVAGTRLLRHRDLIGLGAGARAFYSTERRARVEPFPGINGRPAKCARCKDDIEPGAPSVQCPQIECSLWYHQSEERPCWTYTGACGPCGQPTSFSADFRWTPMEL